MKANRAVQTLIQQSTLAYLTHRLDKGEAVAFGKLRDYINAAFPDVQHNWMVTVRSPMQQLINEKKMVRDVSNIFGPELYIPVGGTQLSAKQVAGMDSTMGGL